MSKNAPAIPFFTDAYLADTRHLTLEEHGAYLQLLMFAWRSPDCALPNDDIRLARMLGVTAGRWAKIKPAVMAFWQLADGRYTQARLSKERAFVEEKRANNSRVAKEGWKWQRIEKQQTEQSERISERNAPPPPLSPNGDNDDANASSAKRADLDDAFEHWNTVASQTGWPCVTKLTPTRQTMLKARLREAEGIEGWRAALARAHASPYLGRDPPSFFTFDWIIKSANFLKLTEGNYDRNRSSPDQARADEMSSAMRTLGFEK